MFASASDRQSYSKRVGSHATKGRANGDAGFTIEQPLFSNNAERAAFGRACKEYRRLIVIAQTARASGKFEAATQAFRSANMLLKNMKAFERARRAE